MSTAADSAVTGPGRLLIAEDEEHLGTLLAQYLRARAFDVLLVRDGVAAVAALAAGGFDAAVVDVQMPGMNGFGVLAAVQELDRRPEIVIASGDAARETAVAALRGGAWGTIVKPYRMAEVELVVQRAIEMRRLRDAVAALQHENDVLRRDLARVDPGRAVADARGTIDARDPSL